MTAGAAPAAFGSVVARLRAAGCVYAEEEADLLIKETASAAALETMINQRVSGLPLEQVLGWAEFGGLRIIVEPGVFVPRRRTEFLVEQAVALARAQPVVVDLCCGSGAIGAALAHRLPGIELYASDIEPAAVHCARRNLPTARVFEGDLYASLPTELRGRTELLVVNAPYVPTEAIHLMPPEARDHEPRVTLDGGPDGMDVHRRVAADAGAWLRPGGHLLIEASERQAPIVAALVASAGLVAKIARDDDHDATVVIGRQIS